MVDSRPELKKDSHNDEGKLPMTSFIKLISSFILFALAYPSEARQWTEEANYMMKEINFVTCRLVKQKE